MTHPKYWLARHNSEPDNVKRVYELAWMLVARVPPPWEPAKRGRPPKFSPRMHAAICITTVCLNLTYREVEGDAPAFLGMTIDHSTVGWAFKRIRENYLKLLLLLLRQKLEEEVSSELFVIDSTGISTPRFKKRRYAFKTLRERVCLKLHALVGYSSKDSALLVHSASVTGECVHDCTQFKPLISDIRAQGEPLIGDPAYDADFTRKFAREHGFRPVIKPRECDEDGPHGFVRREVFKEFEENRELYDKGKVAEGFFGGIEIRYGSKVRCKLLHVEVSNILLMAVAHNLRTYARVCAQNNRKILFVVWIFSTNPQGKVSV